MEKYSKTKIMEKYLGRHAAYQGDVLEVVGYTVWPDGTNSLIVDASPVGGWAHPPVDDEIFKERKSYLYVSINDLID